MGAETFTPQPATPWRSCAGALVPALRPDVAAVRLVDPARRGLFGLTPSDGTHPYAARLVAMLRASAHKLLPGRPLGIGGWSTVD